MAHRSELADLIKVTGRGEGNETWLQLIYVPPQIWFTLSLAPPVDYFASLLYGAWGDFTAAIGEGFVQNPMLIYHYIRFTADMSEFGEPSFQVSTQTRPGLFMLFNRDTIPHAALMHYAHVDFKERDDLDEALKYFEGMSSYNYLKRWQKGRFPPKPIPEEGT